MIQNTLKQFFILILLSITLAACKELDPMVEKVKPYLEQATAASSTDNAISSENMIEAIKQALTQGASDSVNLLGRAQGFSLSDIYRIPLPEQLNKPAQVLRKLGQGNKVDEFENRLNLAAEQSVQQAMPVFSSAIRQMTVQDALNIMQGADNAATMYFKQKTEATLRDRFTPIIQNATSQSGLARSYKSLNKTITTLAPGYSSGLVNIDDYVLTHAMDALFDRIAIEEQMIRQDPSKRGTQLMEEVYGYFAR